MATFDYSSWAAFEPAFNEHIGSADPDVAYRAANALGSLLYLHEAAWGAVPPEPAAAALLGAMRRHPGDGGVQYGGCYALYRLLCQKFPALRSALQRDPAVLATVRRAATVAPYLEDWGCYKELCVWLRPCLGECGAGTA